MRDLFVRLSGCVGLRRCMLLILASFAIACSQPIQVNTGCSADNECLTLGQVCQDRKCIFKDRPFCQVVADCKLDDPKWIHTKDIECLDIACPFETGADHGQCDLKPKPADTTCTATANSECSKATCSAAGKCEQGKIIIGDNNCIVDGKCKTKGDLDGDRKVKAGKGCQICDPGVSKTKWTPVDLNTACNADGLACTTDTCDGKGTCAAAATPNTGCLIDDVCYKEKAEPAGMEGCARCDPAKDAKAWTYTALGAACPSAGAACEVYQCTGDHKCVNTNNISADNCVPSVELSGDVQVLPQMGLPILRALACAQARGCV